MHHHLSLRGKLIIMLSVMASLFLVALDQTIIATALGRIVEDFNAFDSLSWIVTAYLLTTTVTLPIAGKLSDLYGRRRLLLAGIAIFGLGSLFSAMAGSIDQLVYARAFQGIGGGIITANAFTIIGDLFAARERGKWQGLIGATFGLSSIVGPLLGGWLTEGQSIFGITTDWRWTFWINVPIAIIAFILIAIFCPSLRHSKKPAIDYKGAALLSFVLATLVLAVDNTENIFSGILDASGMSLLALRAILFTIVALGIYGFIRTEQRAAQPIVPLNFFKNPNFVRIIGVATFFGAGFMGSILYLTQFNQQVFGASPTESGLMLLPMIGGLMLTSIVSGQIIAKTGQYKIFMQVGIVVATAMVALLTMLTPETPYWHEAIMIALLGAGLGVVMPIMNLAVQNEFKQSELGAATSSNQLFRSLGSAIGVAVFGAVLTSGLATTLIPAVQNDAYVQMLRQSQLSVQLGSLDDPNTLLNLNMTETKDRITDAFKQSVAGLPITQQEEAIENFKVAQTDYASHVTHAFSQSLQRIFQVSAGLMLLASILVFGLKERLLADAPEGAAPGVV